MYNIVIRHLYTLQSDLPDNSSTHLTPYIVITISLTIFPALYFYIPMTVFITGNLYLISSILLPIPPTPSHLDAVDYKLGQRWGFYVSVSPQRQAECPAWVPACYFESFSLKSAPFRKGCKVQGGIGEAIISESARHCPVWLQVN